MEKKTKIILLSAAFFAVLVSAILVIVNISPALPSCRIEPPFICAEQEFSSDGFYITFFNNGKNDLFIQDISISQKGKEKCIFIKEEIKDPERDYYAVIKPGEGVPFITSINHPDGACLMQGLVPGKSYGFLVEITYLESGVKKTISGKGTAKY